MGTPGAQSDETRGAERDQADEASEHDKTNGDDGVEHHLVHFELSGIASERLRTALGDSRPQHSVTAELHTFNSGIQMNKLSLSRYAAPVTAALLALGIVACGGGGGNANAGTPVFTLSSPDLPDGVIPNQFVLNGLGCTGGNVSPELRWSNVPAGTKSLALQVYDPDAPTGSGLWHWAVYDIPPNVTGLAQGAGNDSAKLPAPAFGGSNDFQDTRVNGGNGKYGGPCPPQGDTAHHYVFTLYALGVDKVNVAAGIPSTGTPALFGFVLRRGLGQGLLGTASFTATYARP